MEEGEYIERVERECEESEWIYYYDTIFVFVQRKKNQISTSWEIWKTELPKINQLILST